MNYQNYKLNILQLRTAKATELIILKGISNEF